MTISICTTPISKDQIIPKTKVCSKCGRELPATEEYFNKKSRKHGSKDGFRSDCRECRSKTRRMAYNENKEQYNDYQRNWYKENIEKTKKYEAKRKGCTVKQLEQIKAAREVKKIKEKLKKEAVKKAGKIQSNGRVAPEIDIFGNKRCTKCGEWKPNTSEYFGKRSDSYDGLNRVCKECGAKKTKKNRNRPLKISDKYYKRLAIYDEVRENPDKKGLAQTKCAYCGKWINIKYGEAKARVFSCENVNLGESRIYCPGDQCREACPTYKQQAYPKGFKKNTSREVDPAIRQMCMERDNWTCQKCGAIGEGVILHAHHILSYAKNKIVANDIQNVITLCKSCHNDIHHMDGCRYHELKCSHS